MSDQIPVSRQSEEGLIACLVADPNAIDEVEGFVTPAMLFDSELAGILEAVFHLRRSRRTVDVMTAIEALDALGKGDHVTRLLNITASLHGGDIVDFASEVRAVHQRRELIRACADLSGRGRDLTITHRDFLADVEARITAIVSMSARRDGGLRKLDPHVAYESIMETIKNRGRVALSTTIRGLDTFTSGLGKGHVMVVGGYPGDGKTGLGIQILDDISVRRGIASAFFSLEMPEADIAKRLLSRGSNVKLASMRSGDLVPDQINQMEPAKKQLSIAPVFIYDSPEPTISVMRAECRRLKARVGELGVVVVDYLQLAKGVTKTTAREQEVAEVSRGLKAMAKELDCPVVALAQLNSDGTKRPNSRPRAADLRESKAIWQDADTVVLIHNPNRDKIEQGKQSDEGERELILDKNRHGPCGVVSVKFDKKTATFFDLGDAVVPWPSTTKGATPDYVGGRPDDSDGDGEPYSDFREEDF